MTTTVFRDQVGMRAYVRVPNYGWVEVNVERFDMTIRPRQTDQLTGYWVDEPHRPFDVPIYDMDRLIDLHGAVVRSLGIADSVVISGDPSLPNIAGVHVVSRPQQQQESPAAWTEPVRRLVRVPKPSPGRGEG